MVCHAGGGLQRLPCASPPGRSHAASLSTVFESFKDYVAVEQLDGDNKYDAGEHGLQVGVAASAGKLGSRPGPFTLLAGRMTPVLWPFHRKLRRG